jgi:hypothetical protein
VQQPPGLSVAQGRDTVVESQRLAQVTAGRGILTHRCLDRTTVEKQSRVLRVQPRCEARIGECGVVATGRVQRPPERIGGVDGVPP